MKKLLLMLLCTFFVKGVNAQEATTIQLNAPNKHRGEVMMQALEKRQSVREYADKKLSLQDISDLLWAANGINRPERGLRTAPTAGNLQEIDLYVCFEEGAYLYDAKAHELKMVTDKDVRKHLAETQTFVEKSPAVLLIVANTSRMNRYGDSSLIFSAYGAGIVSQNISLFCSACGLGTVPRAFMNKEKTAEALGLDDTYILHLNHPVGYMK